MTRAGIAASLSRQSFGGGGGGGGGGTRGGRGGGGGTKSAILSILSVCVAHSAVATTAVCTDTQARNGCGRGAAGDMSAASCAGGGCHGAAKGGSRRYIDGIQIGAALAASKRLQAPFAASAESGVREGWLVDIDWWMCRAS